MADGLAAAEVEQRLARLDGLLERIEAMPGGGGQLARETVAALAGVYGESLRRVLSVAAPGAVDVLAADPLVGHLMVLHGLHPDPAAIEEAMAAQVAPPGGPQAVHIPVSQVRRKVRV